MNESDPRSDVHYLGSSENKIFLKGRIVHCKRTRQDIFTFLNRSKSGKEM